MSLRKRTTSPQRDLPVFPLCRCPTLSLCSSPKQCQSSVSAR